MNDIKTLLIRNPNRTLFDIKDQLEDILGKLDAGRSVSFIDKYDCEFLGYESQDYAAVVALIERADEEDKTTIAELAHKNLGFKVAIIVHDNSVFYDMDCSGFGCSLADIFDLSWYEDHWIMIKANDQWATISNHSEGIC